MANIYVGNISYQTTEAELNELFSEFGEVTSVRVIKDRETGRSKGFSFIEMTDKSAADEAIAELNGTTFGGRQIVVNEAQPRQNRRNDNRY